eukprot:CAMPEP_0206136896 /NCGR_PEP_ID=MMETSP1473-20131121/2109_1 /ASSEMBLY_ACC=CAM_ASM_001109 /TAXON_ID=1461547 /ORGANISM="Stichococcus sp, Strain RCC1054" /LENGTH=451 /DNA_ID=CAMNT_0053529733 /DNA_START=163 /DNA_END=1518 /DNA_ORIENTATION=+
MSAVDLCIRDSFARTCVAQVIACTPLHAGKSSKGGQNGHPQSLSHWAVQLSQSVLYAEGGGQPTDLGTLTVADGGTPMPVIDVQRALSGTIVHTVANEEPIAVGATVTVELDWDRRLDHMQHHTGQHLLSAVAEILVGAGTLSWEMHPLKDGEAAATSAVSVELDIDQLSSAQVQAIQDRCNDEIRAARAVTSTVVNPTEAEQVAASPLFRGTLPPLDKIQDGLRVLEIDTLDRNPCGGTHLTSLAQIQTLQIVSASRTKGHAVVSFLAGRRAQAALAASLRREARLNTLLGCGAADHEAAVQRLLDQRRDATKALRAASSELAGFLGRQAVSDVPQGGAALIQRQGADLQHLSDIAAAAAEARPDCTLLLTANDGAARSATADVPGMFLVAGPPAAVKAVGPAVSKALSGKGGGRPGRMQGKAAQLQHGPAALQAITDILRDTTDASTLT